MAITQVGTAITGTALTVSYTQAAGTNNILIVYGATEDGGAHSSVTFDGQNLTKLIESTNGSMRVSMWYLVNPPVTTANIVLDINPTDGQAMAAHSWQDVDQTTPFSSSNSNTGSGANPNVTVNSASGELVLDGYAIETATNGTPGAGQTEITDLSNGGCSIATSKEDGASPNVVMGWTTASSTWAMVGASLKAAGGAPPAGAIKCCMVI